MVQLAVKSTGRKPSATPLALAYFDRVFRAPDENARQALAFMQRLITSQRAKGFENVGFEMAGFGMVRAFHFWHKGGCPEGLRRFQLMCYDALRRSRFVEVPRTAKRVRCIVAGEPSFDAELPAMRPMPKDEACALVKAWNAREKLAGSRYRFKVTFHKAKMPEGTRKICRYEFDVVRPEGRESVQFNETYMGSSWIEVNGAHAQALEADEFGEWDPFDD